MDTITGVLLEPGEYPVQVDIPNTGQALRELIGGEYTVLEPWPGQNYRAICLVNHQDKNVAKNRLLPRYWIVGGNIFLCGSTEDGRLCSLSKLEAFNFRRDYRMPMHFTEICGAYYMQPVTPQYYHEKQKRAAGRGSRGRGADARQRR